MKRETWSKIMAIFALIWVTIWVVWTWLMAILWWETNSTIETKQKITNEDIQKMIDEWKIKTVDSSWASESWNTNTWVIEDLINQTWALEEKVEEVSTWEINEKTETWNKK